MVQVHHFNPHEREARDAISVRIYRRFKYFNPHEREARDRGQGTCACLVHHFNPHEREARDLAPLRVMPLEVLILIHTSVKLVTKLSVIHCLWDSRF